MTPAAARSRFGWNFVDTVGIVPVDCHVVWRVVDDVDHHGVTFMGFDDGAGNSVHGGDACIPRLTDARPG